MKEPENIRGLVTQQPDFIGFIFYPKSPRYVGDELDTSGVPADVKKVGVFVNEPIESMLEKVSRYKLDFVQLHGGESVEVVRALKSKNVGVIKVLSVQDAMPIDDIKEFEPYVDFFLFDTKTPDFGGSGEKFDWTILKQYESNVPFFLSGGVDLEDIKTIESLGIEKLFAIDVNSRFEVSPGLKDIERIKALKEVL
ncbi:phosphoribosylanthranilate isomerase [Marinoscillum sp. MHG1-6]|uniref:phosphoribosylanthranilate isomerase n=1 Tax=Marinoscillum sp. MHG1-6 TaxID=2959627 RepID=UPI002156FD91|nr:phosphoribosylanthranilate isomerase [Marinoscillum sp. MHG1-6]